MKRVPRLALALVFLFGAGMAAGYGVGGMPARARQVEQPGVLPQERVFQSEAEERHFLRAEVHRVEDKWAAADWRTGESFAIEADLRRLRARLEELEQRLVETDPVTAIREQTLASARWHMQIPISQEEATRILGRPPTGSSLRTSFELLGGTYYQHVITPTDPSSLTGVMQIWYCVASDPPQYIVVTQYPAKRYLRTFPPNPVSPHDPRPYVHLDDGTPVAVGTSSTDMTGRPFTPGWTVRRSGASWVSGGIVHFVGGVNLEFSDLLRVIEALSLRKIR